MATYAQRLAQLTANGTLLFHYEFDNGKPSDADPDGWTWGSWNTRVTNTVSFMGAGCMTADWPAGMQEGAGYPSHAIPDRPLGSWTYFQNVYKFSNPYDLIDDSNGFHVPSKCFQLASIGSIYNFIPALDLYSETNDDIYTILDPDGLHSPEYYPANPNVNIVRMHPSENKWHLLEIGVLMNTGGPGASGNADGVMDSWTDGIQTHHITGINFRKYTPPAGPPDNGDPSGLINYIWYQHYIGGPPLNSNHANQIWHDNAVVASEYIGVYDELGLGGGGGGGPLSHLPFGLKLA